MLNILITIFSFCLMEAVAWISHKYIMHGFLWFLHKDHHTRENQGVLEKNDYFFLLFAAPGISSIIIGSNGFTWLFFVGLGIALYGMAYFIVHDLFIHQRAKILRNTQSKYLRAIRRAHKIHHKHLSKEQGECFGMLVVPLKYFKQ